ncbi:MAG: cyclic pyranopterin monophosphate synthase MoaC [Arenicella sp.]|jgi:cyclic pyranopterin phosphate synthase|nr:cyclic pyranopterin monophosphate synthase MoaC [Arenicella sp.]
MNDFTHLDKKGQAHMVDVSAKPETARTAQAEAFVVLNAQVLEKIRDGAIAKGDLLATARIAGIQGAKRCSELIPLCHPLPLNKVSIDIQEFVKKDSCGLHVLSVCSTTGRTGVEMEALTAASIAALTIYDMCKAIDKGFSINTIRLLEKTGGKSGDWTAVEK